jgi:hypothetical protein
MGYLRRFKEYFCGPEERVVSITELDSGKKAIKALTERFYEAIKTAKRYNPGAEETPNVTIMQGDLERKVEASQVNQ